MHSSTRTRSLTRVGRCLLPALILTLLLLPTPSLQQQGHILYVNHTHPTCQGQAPCYATIQAAVTAAQPADTIRIQAGTYPEQVAISGKNDVPGASEADRIVIEADPSAPIGSVLLTGAASQCTNGHALRLQQSKFITIRGLTITGAGGQAISLMGGNNQNQAIHIERNRIFGNGSSECNGGITIARGNPDTLIVNNLIYGNGRNGITFIDADGGPHSLVQNTIYANGWSGVSVARSHVVSLVNNLITDNGTASGSTGGRFGVKREDSTNPQPQGIHLLYNLLCGNRLGEINGPALDGTDAGNLTPTGTEGSGVQPSPGCEVAANLFANLNGPDGLPITADDDVTLAATSPVLDRGMDPRTLGLDPLFNSLFEADYAGPSHRPKDGLGTGTPAFDLGARELAPPNRPPVANAGTDRTVDEGTLVTLDGTASFDPDGDPLAFQWTQTAGPPVALANPTAAAPSFPAPEVSANTGLTFELLVSDGVLTGTSTVTIMVRDVSPPSNAPPVLAPIGNRTVMVGSTLTFAVTATDPDGDPLTYAVSPQPLPAHAAFDPATRVFTFTPEASQVGTVSLTFSVEDGRGGTASESITITVLGAPALSSVTPSTGVQGASLTATMQGSNTHFAAGSTALSFGPNLSVAGSPEGDFGAATVTDPLTASALVAINPTAALGPRTVIARTGAEEVPLPEAFGVLSLTPPAQGGTTVTTLAGTGSAGFLDGPGLQAQFASPAGLALTSGGSLVLADPGNHRIRRIFPDGTVTTVAGSGALGFADGIGTAAQFAGPQGIAVAPDETVYVADTGNHVIRRIAPDGTVTTLAGTGVAGFQDGPGATALFDTPRSLALRADGLLLVGDEGNARIRLVNPADGTVSTLAGTGTPGFLDGPALQAQFGSLAGLALTGDGTLYIADAGNQRIRTLDGTGTVSTLAGDGSFGFRDGPAASARFAEPSGIALDAAGNVYVADAFNSLIRRISPQGEVSTLAGTGSRGLTDGPGTTATFRLPQALLHVGPGGLAVSDTGNHALRLLQIGPTVTSLSPTEGVHGQTVTLTISGTDLAGATALSLLKDGTPDADLTTSDLQANPEGTELRASLTLAPAATLGARVVTVTTPGGTSDAAPAPGNTFTVLGQLSLVPNFVSLGEGQSGVLTIALSAPAPAGGLTVTLDSAAPEIASVPASVTLAAGATTAPTSVSALVEGTTNITASAPGFASGQSTVTVLAPAPSLGSFTPSSGKMGTPVTITGTGFRLVPSGNSVSFTGENATRVATAVVSATPTMLTVAVPTGAITGPLQVTTSGGTVTSSGYFVVLPTQDVTLAVDPTTVTAIAGTSVSLSVRTLAAGGFSGLTQLSLGALPEGLSAGFSPPALGPNASGTLTLTTTGSTPTAATIEVRGTATLDGSPVTRTATAMLNVQAPSGQTTIVGRILSEEATPLPGITVRVGSLSTTTDAAGNFLLGSPPVGTQLVFLDGSTATVPGKAYPTIVLTMTIQAGLPNALPYQPYLHAQKARNFLDISNSGAQRVLTDPEIPGFQMTIPAGVTITGWDGQPNQVVSVRTVPADRLPIPPPPPQVDGKTVYMFYFNKQGGGVPSQPIPVTVPNELELLPGDEAALWYFDEAPDGSRPNAWAMAGTMTVSSDGQSLLTKPGVGIPRFCCGAMAVARWQQNAPRTSRQSAPASKPQSGSDGDPVQLGTGLFVLEKTDLVLSSRYPIRLTRTYRMNDPSPGPFGRGTTWPYDVDLISSGGALFTVIFPGNARARFTLQSDGTYINTTEPSLRGARLTVEPGGAQRYFLRFKDGTTWTFSRETSLIEITDRNGNGIRLERTWDFKLVRLIDAANRTIEITRDSQDRITSLRDPLNRTVSYSYNAAGYLATVTDPTGGVTRYTYDANNRLQTITDPRGIVFLTNEYDSAGRVSRQTQADGGLWQFAYTSVGGLITEARVTNPRGHVTTHRFNPGSYAVGQADALGQPTTSQRAEGTNELLSTTDPLGRVTRYSYDTNGNVLMITDPFTQSRTFIYDPVFNRVTSITDPLGHVTTFTYDATGNLIALTDPLTNTTTMTYNGYGQPLTTTDPLGQTTTFEYDTTGNLVRVTDPLGNATTRSYDIVSRLIAQADPQGKTTRFSYDPLNRLTSITDALNGGTSFTYDANGNLLTVSDARGNTIAHGYGSMDRLSRRIDQLGKPETFSYDGNGNLVSTTDRKGQTTTFTHDALNRRTQATYADGAVAAFTYDAAGRLAQADDTADPHRPITMAFDPLDRLLSETTSLGTVGYQYDPLGRRTQMTVSGQTPVAYTYDANSRLRTITQAPLNPVDIQYDALGRRTLLTLPNQVSTEYQYDAASRLTALIYRNALGLLGDLTYQYDPAGNRVGVAGSWARTLLPNPVSSATYDAANRQLTFGTSTMTFDVNGNLITLSDATGTTTFTWDARNRLTTVNGPSASFSYDAQGRRARKTVKEKTVAFTYDGPSIVMETKGGVNLPHLRGPGIDETLLRIEPDTTSYPLSDGLPSVVALVNPTGDIITYYTYDPFGLTTVGGSPSTNPLQFSRREHDDGGLYYFRARYFHASLGRFIQEDPLGLAGGNANLFIYARNNPVLLIDPLGLQTWPGSGRVTSGFGRRGGQQHNGIDVANSLGGGVVASDGGTVISTDPAPCRDPRCNGPTNQVLVQHPDGSITGYAHVASGVTTGQSVGEGQQIGTTDLSGRSTGPHVHYTYRPGPDATRRTPPTDPREHLPRENNYPGGQRRNERGGEGDGGDDDLGGRK